VQTALKGRAFPIEIQAVVFFGLQWLFPKHYSGIYSDIVMRWSETSSSTKLQTGIRLGETSKSSLK
jgi:hypothetical protein